jgi:hypothetical protein
MSSVSIVPNITSSSPSDRSTASSAAEQITQGLHALSTAIQSGDTTGAATALTAIQTAFAASNSTSVVTKNSTEVQGDLTTMQQALGSGNSTAINNAFTSLQKDLTAPSTAASLAAAAVTPAYVLSLLSALPGDNSDASGATTDVGSNLLSALGAQYTANTTAALNVYA